MNRYIKWLPAAVMAAFVFCRPVEVKAQAATATPGGINNTNITWLGWLTPDQYNSASGTWTNRITSAGTVGDFTQRSNWTSKTPATTGVGQNFHPAIQFRPANRNIALSRMMSQNMIGITANDAFTFIIVHKRTKRIDDDDNIINFGRNGDYGGDYNLYYNNNSSDVLSAGWTTSARTLGAVPFNTTQMVTVDNANAATANGGGIRQYLGGTQLGNTIQSTNGTANTAGTGSSVDNFKVMVGASHYDVNGNGERGLYGDILEVIILKRDRTAYPFMAATMSADFQKLHTYLAVKYGITLTNLDYLTASNLNVWTMTNNTGFSNNIFGIGRDDASGIYQKQAVSSSDASLTVFLGNNLAALNSQNTATINNGDFLMLGNNNVNTITTLATPVPAGTNFSNMTSAYDLNFVYDKRWKAQITNAGGSMTVNMQLPASLDNKYIMVSSTNNFTAANAANIRLYPITAAGMVTGVLINNGDYIAYGGLATGPAQVTAGLKLWLRAEEGVAASQLPAGSSTANGADATLVGYTTDYNGTAVPDGQSVPAISSWTDVLRGVTYKNIGNANQRSPVYTNNLGVMNYKTAVQFWQPSGAGSYLSNATGLMATASPNHTAIFVVNNQAPVGADRAYYLGFGSSGTGQYDPCYGIRQLSGTTLVHPLINTSDDPRVSVDSLKFNQGATSILSYRVNTGSRQMSAGIDGLYAAPVSVTGLNSLSMTSGSTLGMSYALNRTLVGLISEAIVYDHELSVPEMNKIQSYLGLKYGITLHTGTSNTGTTAAGNWDYLLSDSSTIAWAGVSDPTRYGNFHNHVAAIIRDDEGGLMNVQSHSTDKGSVVRMGIGTQLGNGDAAILGSINTDEDFIIWGDNNAIGEVNKPDSVCGYYKTIMNRKWMVRNVTAQPYDIIISPENTTLSVDPATLTSAFPYTGSDSVFLLIAKTEADLNNNKFTKTIPGTFKDGQHQFSYRLTDEFTYFTFGIMPIASGCLDDSSFTGKQAVSFKGWQRNVLTNTYTLDGVTATATIAFSPTNIRRSGYPRATGRGELDVYRATAGGADGVATITIELTSPVNAAFSIAGIGTSSRSRNQVTITGFCDGTTPSYPTLSYNTTPTRATYTINGNTALANLRNASASLTNRNGILLVNFTNGVKKIVITFNTVNRHRQEGIRISPITISPSGGQLPPKFSDEGFAFQKKVDNQAIVTCVGQNSYQFTIYNANCDARNVTFKDTLPAGLTWVDGSLTLDTTGTTVNAYAGSNMLSIGNITVPPTSSVSFRAAVAAAGAGSYDNRATMNYKSLVADVWVDKTMQSTDGITSGAVTNFSVVDVVSPVNVSGGNIDWQVTANRQYYAENDTITLTYTITNSGTAMDSINLDIDWSPAYTNDSIPANAFTYITNSYTNNNGTAAAVAGTLTVDSVNNNGTLTVADMALPVGATKLVFKFKAPAAAVEDLDDAGQPIKLPNGTTRKSDFVADYTLYPDPDAEDPDPSDPCVATAFDDLSGTITIRHAAGKNNVIVNEHITKQKYNN